MRKTAIILVATVLITMMAFQAAAAPVAPEYTIGLNSGFPYDLLELEFEYKKGAWAGGAAFAWCGSAVELAAFSRYYVPLGLGFNFYTSVEPGVIIPFSADVLGSVKIGPGFDFRWKHLRIGVDGGLLMMYRTSIGFTGYVKGGFGVRF